MPGRVFENVAFVELHGVGNLAAYHNYFNVIGTELQRSDVRASEHSLIYSRMAGIALQASLFEPAVP